MKFKLKPIFIIILSLLITTTVLAACSKKQSSIEEETNTPAPTATVIPTEAVKEVLSDNGNDTKSDVSTDPVSNTEDDATTQDDASSQDDVSIQDDASSQDDVSIQDDASSQDDATTQDDSDKTSNKNIEAEAISKADKSNPDKVKDASASVDKKPLIGVEKEVTKDDDKDKEKTDQYMVAIDAGHQGKGNYEKEPIGPGASTTKAKVSSGTQGVASGVAEYKLTLVIAKKVKEELLNRGYEVYMIRETHDVNISNKERADMANESGADIFIRIHADGSTNEDVNGTSTLYPSKDNPYVSDISEKSYALSDFIVDSICEQTDSKNRGAIARDDMSGINWSNIPVSILEMGYMSNKKEDKLMQTEDYQDKIVEGICNGIDEYFEGDYGKY